MAKTLERLFACVLLLGVVAGCSQSRDQRSRQRIAAPPDLVQVLSGHLPGTLGSTVFVPLRPYDRARDLEVLLLSSGSTAFSGMVLPGRSVFLMRKWISPMPMDWLKGVRPDVASCLKSAHGALALPLTLDGVVLVYRGDWWRDLKLPPPDSLAALRDDLLTLRSSHGTIQKPLRCEVPVDELFWDLAWSFEGAADPSIYTYPKVHALGFIQEFDLTSGSGSAAGAFDALLKGEAAAVFARGAAVRAFLSAHPGDADRLSVAPVPSTKGGRAVCLYNGLCLVRPASFGEAPAAWNGFLFSPYQEHLDKAGLESVLHDQAAAPGDVVRSALAATRFHPPPDLGEMGAEFVHGAILDATKAGLSPEEALRRAAARQRLRGGGSGP